MSNQFDRAAEDLGSEFEPLFGPGVRVDLVDRDDEFVLLADLPGYGIDDIDVRLSGDTVHIDASRERSEAETSSTWLRRERRHGSLSRSVKLPGAVDEDDVSAEHTNGVLEVTLPKSGDSDGQSIEIQ